MTANRPGELRDYVVDETGFVGCVILNNYQEQEAVMPPKKVVIIDDSKYVVDKLEQFFTTVMQFDVVATGSDGRFALELYRKYHPDLITLDMMMPNMDGMTALKEILKDDPGANVMMVSAVRGDSMLRCMVLGAKGYVEKPLRFSDPAFTEDFIETLKEILGQF